MADRDLSCQLKGFSLTTAEILYYMPDHPSIIQSFIWQDYDVAPKFPKLIKFLDFWKENLDGPLHKVLVAHRKLIKPTEFQFVDQKFILN